MSNATRKKRWPSHKGSGATKPCIVCGTPFYVPVFRVKRKQTCSKECWMNTRGGSTDPVKAFWLKVEKRGPDECWGWKAQKRWDGYGRFVYKRKPLWSHRFSYELHHGPIPKGMHVLHSCDNPECTNPKHLSVGTHQDNMRDQQAKLRHVFGERNNRNKLTADQVKEIRSLYRAEKSGNRTISSNVLELAAEYGVTRGTLKNAALGRTWKHL